MDLAKIVKLGLEEYHKDKFDQALILFKKALQKTTNNREKGIIYRNIGLCHYSLKNWSASEISFRKSVELGHELAQWELCLSLLQKGNIDGIQLYSSRYFGEKNTFPDLPIKKITTLEQIQKADKILVLNEQGFGDEILFSRGLKLLEGKDFSWQVYPEMLELFKDSFSGNFFDQRTLTSKFVLDHDWWIPNGDLFKMITLSGDYSHLPISKIEKGKKGHVGICFSSNPKSTIAQKKSVDYDVLKKIVSNFNNINWVSLQYGFHLDFAENPVIENFLDTKRVIDQLDLVITVDTAIANLAAAMNKKIILLINDYIDWRWKLGLWQGDIQMCTIEELKQKLEAYCLVTC